MSDLSEPRIWAVQPVLMCRSVPTSIAFYRSLGFELVFHDDPAEPRYAGVARDGVELHLQWHDPREWAAGADRPTYRFVVRGVDSLLEEFRDVGAVGPDVAVRDTEWGTREFHVRDPDRNGLQFYRDL